MRWLITILIVLLGLLQYSLWTGEGSMEEVWRLKRSVEAQQAENKRLRERNQALTAEVQDLKQGQEAIEERARSELGMIKQGEEFYQIIRPVQEP
ncbi:MAG: cell division protein FtsB [Gammaproteobacteria bacterium]|nr:cell division protein FtsB [Gammaproteobacteria bacterium]